MQGKVELFSYPNDIKFMELPENTVFGEYQVIFNLKSNIVYKTRPDLRWDSTVSAEELKENDDFRTIFMCVSDEVFSHLCELYPATAEMIRSMALEKREVTLLFLK